jgi:hypothetical protein
VGKEDQEGVGLGKENSRLGLRKRNLGEKKSEK